MPSAGSKSIFDTLFGCCLGNRGHSSTSASRDGEPASGRLEHDSDERTPLLGSKGRQTNDLNGAGTKVDLTGQKRRPSAETSVDKRAVSRKRKADSARLRAIRDQANDAFFYIDNSQLLPSSSSSRPLNSYGGTTGSKREIKGDATLHQNLVAESDKAERLYRAALSSTASEDAENLALSPEDRDAPLSLVRQMKVTIRESAKDSPSTTVLPQRHPSSSPVEAHARMGLDVSEDRGVDGHRQSIAKFPSLHSLRTLRLGHTSLSSTSIGSEKASPRDVASSIEDEDWSQRGRTRSKRGLAWVDVGQSEEVKQQQSKPKLHEIFSEQREPSDEVAATNKADEEEVPNALRLSSKQTDTMRSVQERLKASSSIAELWDSNQDN